MKKVFSFLILTTPVVLLMLFWNKLPDSIPMHMNIKGEIDRYSDSKWEILTLPIINLVLFGLLFLIPKIDPKRNFEQFLGTYWTLTNVIMLFLCLIFVGQLSFALGNSFDVNTGLHLAIIILFLILGNFFGKIRANYFVGIRTPWTLENEEVWKKTHRMAGILWVGASLVMLLLNFVLPGVRSLLFVPYLLLLVLLPTAYSYLLFKKLKTKTP